MTQPSGQRHRLLLIDNHDSFTYNLADALQHIGWVVDVKRVGELLAAATCMAALYDALVISPGPGHPTQLLDDYNALGLPDSALPTLGICLGHQYLGMHFGLEVTLAQAPMHGKQSALRHTGDDLFAGEIQDLPVMRYHSLVLQMPEDLGNPLRPLAWTSDGELMAFAHRSLPFWGLQFHPESILSPSGPDLLRRWTALAQAKTQAKPVVVSNA